MVSKRWSSEEEEFLRKNYNKMSNKELAEKFGVTTISIQRKLSRLNLIRQVQKKWSAKEEDFLRENYVEMSDNELSKKFGVTPIAIKRKLNRLGLRRGQRKRTNNVQVKKVKKEEIIKKEVNETVNEDISKDTKKISSGSFLKYNYLKTYSTGDIIYHEIFKDKGRIIDKQESNEGYDLLIVEFENRGLKVLVENIK